MDHDPQPGDAPNAFELNKVVAILEQHEEDWEFSTLGRGSMNDSLFDDCNANDVSDAIDIATGFSQDMNTNGIPDECECVTQAYCATAPNSTGLPGEIAASGSLSVVANDFTLAGTGLPPFQTGIFFYGPSAAELPFGDGFLCVSGGFYRLSPVDRWRQHRT